MNNINTNRNAYQLEMVFPSIISHCVVTNAEYEILLLLVHQTTTSEFEIKGLKWKYIITLIEVDLIQ